MANIALGSTITDRITGFKGIVTGRVEYITGCNQLLVSPKVKDDGTLPDARWLDEQRCEVGYRDGGHRDRQRHHTGRGHPCTHSLTRRQLGELGAESAGESVEVSTGQPFYLLHRE